MKKYLMTLACVVLVAAVSVAGTVAFLTDRESVANTFTVGNVDIKLDETKVNPDGMPVEGADRVTENIYHLIPGQTYTKDPTVTVLKGSEESYVRMLLTLNCKAALDEIFAPGVALNAIFNGYDAENWVFEKETADTDKNTVTYEFRYKETVKAAEEDVVLDALFDSFTIPGKVTGEQLAKLADFRITLEGHAIQAATFADADAAWAAFEAQYTTNP